MRASVRAILLLQAAAITAVSAAILAVAGLPLAARGMMGARTYAALVAIASLVALAAATALLFRWVARPVERILEAAERAGGGAGALAPLGPPGDQSGPGLSRAAVAFERTAAALADERERLREKVRELESAGREIASAREELSRAERLAAVGRLAAGVAHEVGNPLGAITGYAALARARAEGGAPGAEVADFLGRIAGECERIDSIVRELLDFARPEPPALRPLRLAESVEGALRLARVQERFRSVAVEVNLPDGLAPVLADARRLSQVFLNLFLNAADAMRGEGEIRVSARADGAFVEVVVADRGPGIPARDLPRIFEPFFTTKAPGLGTGLGLSVCHGIMESFGGTIAAENRETGASFRLRLRTP
jgi:signal transduction histidine kinase